MFRSCVMIKGCDDNSLGIEQLADPVANKIVNRLYV